jgi:predicted RNA-binding protein Jag
MKPAQQLIGISVEVSWSNIGEEWVVSVFDVNDKEIAGVRGKILSRALSYLADEIADLEEAA